MTLLNDHIGCAWCGCRHVLADMALDIAQTLLAQHDKRSAELPVVDVPGQVALPSVFYTLTSREGVPLGAPVEHAVVHPMSIDSAAGAVAIQTQHMTCRQWQGQAEFPCGNRRAWSAAASLQRTPPSAARQSLCACRTGPFRA